MCGKQRVAQHVHMGAGVVGAEQSARILQQCRQLDGIVVAADDAEARLEVLFEREIEGQVQRVNAAFGGELAEWAAAQGAVTVGLLDRGLLGEVRPNFLSIRPCAFAPGGVGVESCALGAR